MEDEKPFLNKMKSIRHLWAFLLLILAFVTVFILRLTANSFSPAWPFFYMSQQSQSGNPATSPPTCSGFFQKTPPRKFVKSMTEFRGVGDEKTLNTQASRKAAQYLKRFQNRGGSQLNVPKGIWVTGSFNLTSNFTLYLEDGALILGSQAFIPLNFFFFLHLVLGHLY
ncbi:hypothetical protein Ancab_026822 [Ancistrocladus abbreviatus]